MLLRQALAMRLHDDPAWLALGHYRRTLIGDWVSDADDPAFFLSKTGQHDPEAELSATLLAYFAPRDGDSHPRCRFPARYHWLKSRLGLAKSDFSERDCKAFSEWAEMLKAHSVSLIYPASYLNSPSSMFGHTFLRLNRENQDEDARLLAYTINYAADVNVADNELFYAYRGVFGGYPGAISVQPFYEKVQEYSDFENRDIWEYTLDLTPAETAQLVRHVWEIRPVRFDYYFIGENCSYRILSLLDVVRPDLALRERFPYRSIPSDTVRAIVGSGLVKHVDYRPSAATVLNEHSRQLTPNLRRIAGQLVDEQITPDSDAIKFSSAADQTAVLEAAYESLRYRTLADKLPRENIANLSHKLLLARSRIDAPSPFKPPEHPAIRDDEGHKPWRADLGFGFFDHTAFGSFRLRSAYHDLTDPSAGYRPGAQIKFLDGSVRYYEDDRFQIEAVDVINIASLTPRTEFIQPLSWSVGLGARRKLLKTTRPLVGYLDGGIGLSYEIGGGMIFGLVNATLEASEGIPQGVDLGLGPRIGWLYQGFGGQGLLDFRIDCYLVEDKYCAGGLHLDHTVNLGRDYALNLRLGRERGERTYASEFLLSVRRYF
ncbi:DUF4105 domain-containing protein [Methylocaldum sp.]|uniref:Lnb N-terminal periplasmic domain-containing protein n=1 Tax=Methylocaldum sp. TaxID=1969727 RepID=UPI002D5B5814|nr:DUF4105 domain-containing protein [Methylocaldum sp.]HYE37143.1 DUF4105 domain-containing protein [Methylocaldum sp.]